MRARTLLREVLLEPHKAQTLSPSQWDLLIRQARRSNLLAKLSLVLDGAGSSGAVPNAPRQHLHSAEVIARRQKIAVRWEVECIREALDSVDLPVLLLKGAAYELAGLPAAEGRLFSDVDILVPKNRIEAAESALMLHGWQTSEADAYDQRYYRRWMHELPPMQHVRRGTSIDVHHNILPDTARLKTDAGKLLAEARPVPGQRSIFVLQPVDMLLHSAAHLFHEGEFDNGLRDLFDLDSLLRHFGKEPSFWPQLTLRAKELGLTRPLYYALRSTRELLRTPIPAQTMEASSEGRPAEPLASLMHGLFERVLQPQHASVDSIGATAARLALYVRSHWLRMPAHLLAYHLGRKVLLGMTKSNDIAIEAAAKPEPGKG
jgi:Uncharacterised nucleotidyltransferase